MRIWAIQNPLKIHCYACMLVEAYWGRLRSVVINMYIITMAWRCISPWSFHRSLQRRREIDIFHICQQISAFWGKNNPKKKKEKRGKPRLNARKHYESESINRNFSEAVLHVKPSCNNGNLNDIGISLQRADSGSYHILVTETKIFRIIWKLAENCQKICIRYDEQRLITAVVLSNNQCFLPCLDKEKIITKLEIKDLMKS